eukprot:scaffold97953_cov73-Phaeocystis_antarctica.AAC.2
MRGTRPRCDVVAHVGRRLDGVISSVHEHGSGQPGRHQPSTATLPTGPQEPASIGTLRAQGVTTFPTRGRRRGGEGDEAGDA